MHGRGSTASLGTCMAWQGLTSPRFPALQILVARPISSPAAPKLCSASSACFACMHAVQCNLASEAGEKGETGSCKLRLSSGGPTTIHSLCAQSSLHCTALHSAAAPPSPIIHRSLSCSAHTARLMTTADALATHPIVFFPSGGGPLGRRGRRSVDGGRGPRGRARPVPAGCMHAHMYQ